MQHADSWSAYGIEVFGLLRTKIWVHASTGLRESEGRRPGMNPTFQSARLSYGPSPGTGTGTGIGVGPPYHDLCLVCPLKSDAAIQTVLPLPNGPHITLLRHGSR